MVKALTEYTKRPPEAFQCVSRAGVVGNSICFYQSGVEYYKVTYINGEVKVEPYTFE